MIGDQRNKKATSINPVAPPHFAEQIIFWRKPGYAIITEGVHDLSVDCMNTSFLFGEY